MAGNVLPIANTIQLWQNKRLVSNLYQDDTNMRESAYRTLNRQNYSVSFGPTSMGSTAQSLNFNKDSIVNHVLVEFELRELDETNLSNGMGLPEGWAWMLCRRIVMQYSGSNALEIQGRDNFIRCMAECETKEKRAQLLALGGNRVYLEGGQVVGADADGVVRGAILIYLPHSSVSGAKQIGFDCSQTNSAPIIRMDLRDASEMWTELKNLGDSAAVVTDITPEMKRVEGKFYVGETAMIDSINSRRDKVGPMGNAQSLMFFAYPNYWSKVVRLSSLPTSNLAVSQKQEVTVDSFLNGSLQYLILYVERLNGFETSIGGGAPTDNRPKRNPLSLVRLTDIKVTYGGGNSVYEAPTERIATLIDAVNNPLDSTFSYNKLSRSGAVDTVTIADDPSTSYFYRIQISQFSELYKMFSLLQTGANLGSDVLKLSFKIIDNFGSTAPVNIDYQVNVQQVYQTSMTVARGNVIWNFVNPSPQALPAQLSIST